MQTLEAWHLQESRRLHLLLVGMLRSETYAHPDHKSVGNFRLVRGHAEGVDAVESGFGLLLHGSVAVGAACVGPSAFQPSLVSHLFGFHKIHNI